jgi:hypothetical protein
MPAAARPDSLVSRIALYPDPLLAQVLAAATFPDQIQDAARWADEHRGMRGDDLGNAIAGSNLPFDPSVQSLLPFPDVLDMMASDMNWTGQLGDAVLSQRPDVMDAVQRMRHQAESYGYLRSGPQMRVVDAGPAIEILPYDPAMIYVPVYDPYIVYAPPRPGFFIGGAIGFGFGFPIRAGFFAFGWGGGFNWYNHSVIVHNTVWNRTWVNRTVVNHNVFVNRNQTFYRNQPPVQNAYRGNSPAQNAYRYNPPAQNAYRANTPAPMQSRSFDRRPEPQVQRQSQPQSFRGTESGRSSQSFRGAESSHAVQSFRGGNERGGRGR